MPESGAAVIAVDLGGTTIKAAVAAADGGHHHELTRETPVAEGPDAVVAALRAIVVELADAAWPRPRAVAIAVPGVVDPAGGRAVWSANVGLRDVPIRDLVQAAVGLPTLVEHDVYAAGVAEREVGAAAGVADHLVVVIGTGIAGVVHAGGRTLRGARGVAGELGHIPVWPGGAACPCGQHGCLERYASAAGIARRYAELGGEAGLGAQQVAARRDHDPAAEQAWREATTALAIAFTTVTMLLDPALIVLAGGLSAAGETLRAPVQEGLAARITWREPPPLRLSPLGARAGLLGAAILARRLT